MDDGTMDMDVGVHTTDGKTADGVSESSNIKPNPRKRKKPKIEFTVPPPRLHVKPKMTTHQKQYPGGSVRPTSNKRS